MYGKKNPSGLLHSDGLGHYFSSVTDEADEVDDPDGAAVETETAATSAPSLPPGLLVREGWWLLFLVALDEANKLHNTVRGASHCRYRASDCDRPEGRFFGHCLCLVGEGDLGLSYYRSLRGCADVGLNFCVHMCVFGLEIV